MSTSGGSRMARGLPEKIRVFRDFRELLDEMDRRARCRDHRHAAPFAGRHFRGRDPPRTSTFTARSRSRRTSARPATLRMLVARAPNVVTQMGNQGLASDSYRRFWSWSRTARSAKSARPTSGSFPTTAATRATTSQSRPTPTAMPTDGLGPLFRPGRRAAVSPRIHARGARWRDFATGMLGMGGSHSCHMTFNALARLGDGARLAWETEMRACEAAQTYSLSRSECLGRLEPLVRSRSRLSRFSRNGRSCGSTFRLAARCRRHASIGTRASEPTSCAWAFSTSSKKRPAVRSIGEAAGPASRAVLIVGTRRHGAHEHAQLGMRSLAARKVSATRRPAAAHPARRKPRTRMGQACRGRGPKPMSNFDYAGPVLELLLLGNICTLLGRPIEFDPIACKMVNDEDANRALTAAAARRLDRMTAEQPLQSHHTRSTR